MKAPALFGLAATAFVLSATGAPGAEWPTLNELGYPDIVSTTWHALAGPVGLPKEIADRVNRETIRALDHPDVRKNFEGDGIETRAMTPAELTRFVQSQVTQRAPIIKATIKAE